MCFLWQDLSVGKKKLRRDLDIDLLPTFEKKRNLDHNVLTKSDRALMLHISISCDKTFLLIPIVFI